MCPQLDPETDRAPRVYWLLGAIVVAYVVACTGGRDNLWGADSWEHHRAFRALTRDLWHPGNPTFAIDTPSARYTPYSVFWALVSRATGLDPYDALSLAAAVNTGLLVLSVPFLLGRFGEARSSAAALLVMVSLYGGAPGTTNSYALADLPVHQVNFSAACFSWVLILLGVFQGYVRGEWGVSSVPLMVALSVLTMLDHGMTGSWGQFSLWLFVLMSPVYHRARLALTVIAIQVCTLLFCLVWPWYDFRAALTVKAPSRLVPYGIQILMSTRWCVPAVALAVLAMSLRGRHAVRVFLSGGYLCSLAGLLVFVLPIRWPLVSSISRYPMPGLIYMHLALGILAHDVGLFRPGTWPKRIQILRQGDRGTVAQAAGEVVLATAIAYFLAPQVYSIVTEPALLRPYIAPLLGKENKQLNLLSRFRSLLRDVGPRDIVLSDDVTMWCVPSVSGRIVHALHAELFVPEDEERMRLHDTNEFFQAETSDRERVEILRRYGVRWIILNNRLQDPAVVGHLLREPAVVRREDFLVLMDAHRWIETVESGMNTRIPAATSMSDQRSEDWRGVKRCLAGEVPLDGGRHQVDGEQGV
jgi:hypothetical protein